MLKVTEAMRTAAAIALGLPYQEAVTIVDGHWCDTPVEEIPSSSDADRKKSPEAIVVLVEYPVFGNDLVISGWHRPSSCQEPVLRLRVDLPHGASPSPIAFAKTQLGRSLIDAVRNNMQSRVIPITNRAGRGSLKSEPAGSPDGG